MTEKYNTIIRIKSPIDKIQVISKSKIIARRIGFTNEKEIEEILITVSELASNLIKHTNDGGEIKISCIKEEKRKGIKIESIDQGPGIPDVELALVDGYSTIGSLGYGLGSINRLTDVFNIISNQEKGTHIITKKWLKSTKKTKKLYPLDFGGATRAYPGYRINGDAFYIKRWDEYVLVGLIDGLGHGPLANKASREALQYIKKNFNQPLRQLMLGTNIAIQNTRGIVLSLALFNLNTLKITFSGIGNIETRTYRKKLERCFISHRGIVGRDIPTPRIIEGHWVPGMIMIFFTDGIDSSLNWDDYSCLSEKPARLIAYRILEDLGKDRDDATVIIVKDFSDSPSKS